MFRILCWIQFPLKCILNPGDSVKLSALWFLEISELQICSAPSCHAAHEVTWLVPVLKITADIPSDIYNPWIQLLLAFPGNVTLVTKVLTMMMSHSNRSSRCHTSHLGLFSLLLSEDEECIPGQEAGNEDIQEGNVLPEEIYWFQHEHTAPYTEKEDKYFKTAAFL